MRLDMKFDMEIAEILNNYFPFMSRFTSVIVKEIEKNKNEESKHFIAHWIGGMMNENNIIKLANRLSEKKE